MNMAALTCGYSSTKSNSFPNVSPMRLSVMAELQVYLFAVEIDNQPFLQLLEEI